MASITPQQHMLLLVMRGHPSYLAVNITEIAEHPQVRHHSASLLIDRAVKREPPLLRRDQDPVDRRRALVSLSPAGEDILERIIVANRRVLADLDHAITNLRASFARV